MFNDIFASWFQPMDNLLSDYVVSIDGVDYLSLDTFFEVFFGISAVLGEIFR